MEVMRMRRELSLWNPFQELSSLQRELNRLFMRAFGEGAFDTGLGKGEWVPGTWTPALDCYSQEGNWIVRTELPGVDPKEIHISVMGDQLYLRGERKAPERLKKEECLFQECYYGPFERTITLPHSIPEDKIKASYEQGVLYIRFPKLAEKGRTIEIQTEEPQKIAQAA
jgi:HSP20 family protein